MRSLLLSLCLVAACSESAVPERVRARAAADAAPETVDLYTCESFQDPIDASYDADGLSAAEALSALEGERVHALKWDARGEQTVVHLDVWDARELRHVWSETPGCGDSLLIDITVSLATDDGRLQEVFDAAVRYEGDPVLRLERWIALDQLVGVWSPVELDPDQAGAVDVEIVANLSAGDSSGEVALHSQRADGQTQIWDAARWPAP